MYKNQVSNQVDQIDKGVGAVNRGKPSDLAQRYQEEVFFYFLEGTKL